MFWLPRKDSSVYAMIDGHGCFLLEEFSPLHNPSYLSLNSQFPDRIGLGCALHEVRNTGEECVWQSPGQLSNVYSVGGWDARSLALAEIHQPEHSCIIRDGRLALKCQGWKASHQILGATHRPQGKAPLAPTPGFRAEGHTGHAEPLIGQEAPPPSSLLTKRAILVMLSGLALLFCLPSIFSPRRTQCFWNFILFIHYSGFWGREVCMPIL